ncbi:MAG TPA: terminase family protein [Rhizomicrobium sp.]|nr:terminase family protein [Rhizomicrobium sp.]
MTTAEKRKFLESLSADEAKFLGEDWSVWARPEQLPPPGDWRVWLFLAGRGSGKTRAGAEWIASGVHCGAIRRIALLGATYRDARAVMIEGESGLLGASGAALYQPSNNRVLWPSGAVATILSAEEPDGVRGHQFDAAWGDELCKWPEPQAALDMLEMALRIGRRPRMLLTTTPRNIPALKALMARGDAVVTRGATRDNGAFLAPGFVESLEARYGGTRLGRQELDGEIIEDNDAAIWKRAWIEKARVRAAPELARILVAVDPPASAHGDECGIVVAGRGEDGEAYVIADLSQGGLTPSQWAGRVADAYLDFKADLIVAEANQGGDMVKAMLLQVLPNAAVKTVHATRAKRTRAMPAAALYEQGRVRHAGVFPELEDQMCNYDGGGSSPDRLDALVWALTELYPMKKQGVPKVTSLSP